LTLNDAQIDFNNIQFLYYYTQKLPMCSAEMKMYAN